MCVELRVAKSVEAFGGFLGRRIWEQGKHQTEERRRSTSSVWWQGGSKQHQDRRRSASSVWWMGGKTK